MDDHDEEDPEELLMDPGDRLVYRRGLIDRGEAHWLELLAEFDRHQLWQLDGQLSCVAWLMWRVGLSRGTAFEKLRIAHELSRRPAIAQAFASGAISYSAVRAISRLDRPDPAVDEALVYLAKVGTVRDLEQAIHRYQMCVDQERAGTIGAPDRRGIRVIRGLDGYSTAEITLEDTELDELLVALRVATDRATGPGPAGESVDESSHGDSVVEACAGEPPAPVDESPREDSAEGESGADGESGAEGESGMAGEPALGWQMAADALMDLVRTGLAHLGEATLAGADRYMVHLVVHADTGHTQLLDGTPLPPAIAGRVGCDASTVTHFVSTEGETLALGRRTRQWSTAQHRAISVRDGGTCRFPGCTNRITDIHHLRLWATGGATDIDNGLLVCQRHHTLTHHGYRATGQANHQVAFHRPDGTTLGISRPRTYAQARGIP